MRHRKAGVKLNRTSSHRNAMFRNMVTSLFKYDRIQTTDAKAKELRRWADKLITLAKKGDLHSRRLALSIVREKEVVHKLFEEAEKRFGAIQGGYTRVVKVGRRPGDAAPISLIELVAAETKEKKKKTRKKAKSGKSLKAETQASVKTEEKEAPSAVPPEDAGEPAKKEDVALKEAAAPAEEDAEEETAQDLKAAEDMEAAPVDESEAPESGAEAPEETAEKKKDE
jgi:large subunit ribosomal protein L17